jgi:hypothetical protein
MKSQKRGKNISECEVLNVSPNGVWLLANDHEYFLPHEKFPWFRNARIAQICNVEMQAQGHLHWPDLDVDLDLDSIQSPEKYPLVFKK